MHTTLEQYRAVMQDCRQLFEKKLRDYGAAWRILRLPSLTDQLFIKAQRLRSIEEKGVQKVEEEPKGEYIGIYNYSLMALVQWEQGVVEQPDFSREQALSAYDEQAQKALELMERKNHDYGEAWRDMRMKSFTDLILQKLLRIKQIEGNKGITRASEGIDANYLDIANYALFALIKISESK